MNIHYIQSHAHFAMCASYKTRMNMGKCLHFPEKECPAKFGQI